jgi:hypothetical protein
MDTGVFPVVEGAESMILTADLYLVHRLRRAELYSTPFVCVYGEGCRNHSSFCSFGEQIVADPGLRRGPAAARLLGLLLRIPPGAWVSVESVVCCQAEFSASG